MAQNIRRIALRTAAVLLAAGVVVAVTYAVTPRYDPKKAEATALQETKKHPPAPGSEDALRRVVDEIQRGQPDYAGTTMADAVRKQLPEYAPLMAGLGPVQSVAYMGGNFRYDFYWVTFRKGSLRAAISMGKSGTIEDLQFSLPSQASPKQWSHSYAALALAEGAAQMAYLSMVILALAAFGRFVLRLRL